MRRLGVLLQTPYTIKKFYFGDSSTVRVYIMYVLYAFA